MAPGVTWEVVGLPEQTRKGTAKVNQFVRSDALHTSPERIRTRGDRLRYDRDSEEFGPARRRGMKNENKTKRLCPAKKSAIPASRCPTPPPAKTFLYHL